MSKLLPRIIFPHNAVMAAPSSDSLACPAPYNAITHPSTAPSTQTSEPLGGHRVMQTPGQLVQPPG